MKNKNLIQQKKIQADYYVKTASNYDDMHSGDIEHELALSYINLFIKNNNIKSILDVGCGTGRGINNLKENNQDLFVLGVEPIKELLLHAFKENNINNYISCGEGEHLPFRDKSFDAVCELAVLHHVSKPELIIKEMMRISKKAIFISDSNRFGQGSTFIRWIKFIAYKIGIWNLLNLIKTKGKGYIITEGDGLSYSYSVYDNYKLINDWADHLIVLPTKINTSSSWLNPLLTSSHVLLCAFKHHIDEVNQAED